MWTSLIASLLAIGLKGMMKSDNEKVNSIGSFLSITLFSIAIVIAVIHFTNN